jgi:large subunit ribosomal protein L32
MAVPKRKTTPSKRGLRRSHDALHIPTFTTCEECGADKLPHQACLSCGFHRGLYVLKIKNRNQVKENKRKKQNNE